MGKAGRSGFQEARRPPDAEAKILLIQTNGRRRQVWFPASKATEAMVLLIQAKGRCRQVWVHPDL